MDGGKGASSSPSSPPAQPSSLYVSVRSKTRSRESLHRNLTSRLSAHSPCRILPIYLRHVGHGRAPHPPVSFLRSLPSCTRPPSQNAPADPDPLLRTLNSFNDVYRVTQKYTPPDDTPAGDEQRYISAAQFARMLSDVRDGWQDSSKAEGQKEGLVLFSGGTLVCSINQSGCC